MVQNNKQGASSIEKDNQQKLSAFEMWVWRTMEKINWVEKVQNDEGLQSPRMAGNQEYIGHSTTMQTQTRYMTHCYNIQPNRGQNVEQSNQRKKVPTNAQRHHK